MYKERGDANYCLSNYKDAIDDYDRFIKDPKTKRLIENLTFHPTTDFCDYFHDAYCSRGDSKLKMQDYKGAKTDFFRATYLILEKKHRYKNANAFLGIGKAFYYMDDYYEAIQYINRAIKLDLLLHDAYFFVGLISFECEKYNDALSYFTKALNLKPSNKSYLQFKMITNYKLNNLIKNN